MQGTDILNQTDLVNKFRPFIGTQNQGNDRKIATPQKQLELRTWELPEHSHSDSILLSNIGGCDCFTVYNALHQKKTEPYPVNSVE